MIGQIQEKSTSSPLLWRYEFLTLMSYYIQTLVTMISSLRDDLVFPKPACSAARTYLLFPSCTKPASLGQPQTTWKNLGPPQTWTSSENLGRAQRILDKLKESWTTSENLGQPETILDKLRESWTTSDSFEQLQTILDNLRKSHSFGQHLTISRDLR